MQKYNSINPIISAIRPATWLGVIGGGQLGRMFTQEAQAMGYKVAVLDPEQDCPAGDVADRHFLADYRDETALIEMAHLCQAITTEFENVSVESLALLGRRSFISPDAASISVAQNRVMEKSFFTNCAKTSKVLPAPHYPILSALDIDKIPSNLLPGILKTARLGYDGKRQIKVRNLNEVRLAFSNMNGVACVLEKMLPLAYEVSVLAACSIDGVAALYPIAENVHRNGILFTTTVPGPNVCDKTTMRAQHAALVIIEQLAYVGVICIEFFVLPDGSIIVNEIAPRPHNSGHYTMDACVTSQFSQQVRAMARLPLGDTRQHSPAVMLNILGDIWFDGDSEEVFEPAWDKILAFPAANLHLYGKAKVHRARKMGHITFIATTLEEAQQQLIEVCDILGIET